MFLSIISATFDFNSPIMYVLYAIIAGLVLFEAIYYLVKSIKRAKVIGMDLSKVKQVINTSINFSILPSIGIAIALIALVPALGIAFPAIRLSVIGAIQYESQMANATAEAIVGGAGKSLELLLEQGVTAQNFATMAFVMTVSIISGPLLVILFYKKLQPKVASLGKIKGSVDGKTNLGDLLFQIGFVGMVVGYFGMSVETIGNNPSSISSYFNFIAVIIACISMYFFDLLVKKFNWRWLDGLSTSFSMLLAMIVVAVISFFTYQNGI